MFTQQKIKAGKKGLIETLLMMPIFFFLFSGIVYASTWANTYGSSDYDSAYSIQQTFDGGYIVAGETWSFGAGLTDAWVLKLKSNGEVEWQKTYGGSYWDGAYSIQQTFDGGYIVAGYTLTFGAGNADAWVLKLKSDGEVEWQKTYGGSYWDGAFSIQQTSDGYIMAGETESFGAGEGDAWILKLDESGDVSGCPAGLIGKSNVTGKNTDISPQASNAFVIDTIAAVKDTAAIVDDTDVTPGGVCAGYYAPNRHCYSKR